MTATRDTIRIALALSGGGVRATAFHLGVLGRLADEGLLEKIAFLSSVSGGSLAGAIVYALSDNIWPTSAAYQAHVYPGARHILTRVDLTRATISEGFRSPWLIPGDRAKLLARALQHHWGVQGHLKDLLMTPRWIINATTYESGKNWRFTPQRMGDYKVDYVLSPSISVAEAVAASAGYPFFIGPLVLTTRTYKWSRFALESQGDPQPTSPQRKRLHLWDGGIYDNLGVEALYKPGRETFRDDYNFLIVSDASGMFKEQYPFGVYRRAKRLLDIAMEQVRSLRARSIVSHFVDNPNSGAYLKMGNSAATILSRAGMITEDTIPLPSNVLSDKCPWP